MNMVEYAAQAIRSIENQADQLVTDPAVIVEDYQQRMLSMLGELDEETAKKLEIIFNEIVQYRTQIAFTEGFQRGIQFIVTAMTSAKKF